MSRTYTATGILPDGRTVRLDEKIPIVSCKVRVTVEVIEVATLDNLREFLHRIDGERADIGVQPLNVDEQTRRGLLQILGSAMSDLSEEAYCGGWVVGTEYLVPELCRRVIATGQTQSWRGAEITPALASGLRSLADQLGAWANYHTPTDGYVPFQPFPIPPEYLDALAWEEAREAARRAERNSG